MKVSIVVPVYNSAKYLGQCLDSVLGQTHRDIEALCINDGSTDGSLEILEGYAARDSRVRVFSKENEGKGAASARNLGLEHATGEYVQFLDSDDFFEPDMVERMVEKAETLDADLVVCRADRFDDRLQAIERDYWGIDFRMLPQKEPFSYQDCPEHIFQIADWVVWNKLYRRDLLERHGLRFERIPISDDQYVPSLALVLAKRIAAVDKAMVHYRFNTGRSQIDGQAKHPEAAYAATYSVVEKMKEYGVFDAVRRSYLNVAIRVFREYFDRMTDWAALEMLYRRFREVEFPRLGAESLPADYFYDWRLGAWYEMMQTHTLEEILLLAARGHGDGMTTAVLRFRAPLGDIPPGSRVVLVGKNRAGRYWHSQMLLSGACEVAAWVPSEDRIPAGLSYDRILIAR